MIDSKNIQQQTQSKKFKILLAGDSCIDEYLYGTCDRLNPEAPVPVLKVKNIEVKFGMAANVLHNLKSFGCDVDFITGDVRSVKKRYIDIRSKQHIIRVDDDKISLPFTSPSIQSLTQFDAIVLSDYNKGFLTYENIIDVRNNFQGPIFIDTKKQNIGAFQGCFVKINETEYKNRTSINDQLIVTLGSKGAMYRSNDIKNFYPGEPAEVVDVCGAGDTFLAALTYKYLETKDIGTAIRFANKCSAITVQHRGVYALTQKDIDSIVL